MPHIPNSQEAADMVLGPIESNAQNTTADWTDAVYAPVEGTTGAVKNLAPWAFGTGAGSIPAGIAYATAEGVDRVTQPLKPWLQRSGNVLDKAYQSVGIQEGATPHLQKAMDSALPVANSAMTHYRKNFFKNPLMATASAYLQPKLQQTMPYTWHRTQGPNSVQAQSDPKPNWLSQQKIDNFVGKNPAKIGG